MRRFGLIAVVVLLAGFLAAPAPGASAADLSTVHVGLRTAVTGLSSPMATAWRPNDSTLYVAERSGSVRRIVNGKVKGNALTIPKSALSTDGERGLLGITFSPGGTKLYTNSTDANGGLRVDEYTMKGTRAVKKSRRNVLYQPHPLSNHNGGQILFGPDGKLYVSYGDGGGGGDPNGNAQNLGNRLGKIVRINPAASGFAAYSSPADNPFVGQAGKRPEIWMYGLRNPWRFTFDRANGDMWIGDVGQNLYEEVDYAPAGQKGINWGWNLREGFHQYNGAAPPGARDPVIERPHTAGDCAITGGYVYRGLAIPKLYGAYVYGDFCTGEIMAAVQTGGVITQSRDLGINVANLNSFGQDPSGELYAISLNGTIYKLTA